MQPSSGGQILEVPEQAQIQLMLSDPSLREKVMEDMRSRRLPLHTPCIKLEVRGREGCHYSLEQEDVLKVFSVFGEVVSVKILEGVALVMFRDVTAAYFSQRTLNGKSIAGLGAALEVSWYNNEEAPASEVQWPRVTSTTFQASPAPERTAADPKPDSAATSQAKFTCRYDIQIDNDKEFQVARRLIGPKGCNMKKIVDICSRGSNCQGHDIVKLRLRGHGSGFKEGPNKAGKHHTESDEPLHMCVSSKYLDKYQLACRLVQELIQQVYAEYADFCRARGHREPRISLKKSESISGRPVPPRPLARGDEDSVEDARPRPALRENTLKQNEASSKVQFDTSPQVKKSSR